MTKQKQMTENELDQVSGGPHIRNFNGRTGVIGNRASRHIVHPDYLQIVHPDYRQSKNGKPSIGYTEVEWT